jgi:hypothetical protein
MSRHFSIFFAISGTCVLALAGLGIGGCSGGDPGVEGLQRATWDGGGTYSDGGGPKPDGGRTDGGGSDSGGGMDSGPVDAGVNAFTGAGAYASNQPGTSAVTRHTNGGVGTTPGRAANCLNGMGCHGAGSGGREFLFGGTIFKDVAGTMPANNVEVRVRGSDGMGYLTNSDADGNFWRLKGADTVMYPALTGARNGMAQQSLMNGTIANGACNNNTCHGPGGIVMHVP